MYFDVYLNGSPFPHTKTPTLRLSAASKLVS